MIKRYVSKNAIVLCAEPETRSGTSGFVILYSNMTKTWFQEATFKEIFREMTEDEIDLIFTEGAAH